MTLMTTVLTALLLIVQQGLALVSHVYLDPDDPRDKRNQAPFHEEQMLSAGQSGHCPHG
jgi:hypothetical protein